MADSSIGQAQAFYGAMNTYFGATRAYYQDATVTPPNFMELLPNLSFTQLITESQKAAKGNPSMVSGALIETTSSIFAVLREAGMRAKIRSDYFADAEGSASEDANFYQTQGQSMISFINGRNDMQN